METVTPDNVMVIRAPRGQEGARYVEFTVDAAVKWNEDMIPHARKMGLENQMLDSLYWIAGREQALPTKMWPDFAPHSLCFSQPRGLHGGFIYQGPDSPADGGAPSFTVSLAGGVGWFCHT